MSVFFIAAGGTGGHIYPGVALAEALKQKAPDSRIYFVGTPHGLENKIVKAKGYDILHLNIGRLNKNVSRVERLKTFLQLPMSFLKSFSLLRKYKPQAVIGVGGHASGPMLLVASFLRIPTVIWEPNAMPGMANRLLSRFVDLACVVFEESKNHLRGVRRFLVVGLPLRSEIERLAQRERTPTTSFKVLIFGGSQGARGLNKVTLEFIQKNQKWLDENEIIHQTGAADFEGVKNSYGDLIKNPHLKVVPYIEDMASAYQWADIVVCRSGTGTLAELAALGKPSVLIPFPFASDNHQQKNAEVFAAEEAALMILQKDLTQERFGETLQKLKSDLNFRENLVQNSKKFFKPQAAQKMAAEIFNLIEE
jgi:UDP-N-acetylglucosamine--N-acetylmuramyl-(pentapeptide) pyrophosphoryl-undecaprenol N-acetylglucosamine transferase